MAIDIFKNSSGGGAFAKIKNPVFKTTKTPKPKEDRALETGGSNLEKVLSFLDRPGAAERQVVLNALKSQPLLQGAGDILTGKSQDHPSGSDVIQQLRGGQVPDTKMGRAAEAVAGFALDVLNPADPLNWIGVGELSKAGKAAEKLGKLSEFTKGLQTGERSIVSARLPLTDLTLHAPASLSKSAGGVLEGLGAAAKALPGVEAAGKFFKPTFNRLRTYSNVATAKAGKIAQTITKAVKGEDWRGLQKEAVQSVKAGDLDKIAPEMSAHYKSLGYNPEQIVGAEVKRALDKNIAETGIVSKTPKAVKAFIEKVPTKGDTLEPIQKLADLQAPALHSLGVRAKSLGIQGTLGENFGAPRMLSDATKKAIDRVGESAGPGSAGRASRVFKEFTSQQVEAAKADPKMQAVLFQKMFGNQVPENNHILDMFKKVSPEASTFYEMNTGKNFEKYLATKSRQISTAETVGEMMKDPVIARKSLKDWGNNPAVKVPIPAQFKKVMNNLKKEGVKVNVGHMYMHPDTAKEFNNFVGIMTNADQMNRTWGFLQTMISPLMSLTNAFKRMTLLGPIGTIPYGMRNAMSNGIQSAMAGALSPQGTKAALFMGNALIKAGDDPAKFAEITAKLGEFNGLDMGKELAAMKAGNLFNEGFTHEFFNPTKGLNKFERAIGIGVSGKANEAVENVFRIQHYMTRRLQGWTPNAAMDDVRKYLYDYTGGLSPQMQNLKAVFPFIAWTRLNVPVMFEHMIKHPGRFAIPQRAKQNIEDTLGTDAQGGKPDERALDEYIKGDWHIRWNYDEKTGKWSYIRLKNTIPMADLEDFTSVSRFVDLMMSSLTPFIKTPYENATNQSTFFKTAGGNPAPIENYPGETQKFLGMDISKKNINWLRNVRPLNILQQFSAENPSDMAASLAGISSKGIDFSKATEYAKREYQKRKANLMISKKIQEKKGKSTGQIDQLLQDLKTNSYVPSSR